MIMRLYLFRFGIEPACQPSIPLWWLFWNAREANHVWLNLFDLDSISPFVLFLGCSRSLFCLVTFFTPLATSIVICWYYMKVIT